MHLVRCDITDAAVMMLKPVPAHEIEAPVPGFLQRDEAIQGILRTVLAGPEHGLGVRIVVAHPWSATGRGDPQFVEGMQHGGPFHGASVIRVQDERMSVPLKALGKGGFSDEMAGMLGGFLLPDFPAHDVPAENVEDKVEVVVQPLDGSRKIRDVPGPDLVRCCGDKAGYSPFAWLFASAPVTDLGRFMHHPVEAGFRGDIDPLVRKGGYNLTWWFVRVL